MRRAEILFVTNEFPVVVTGAAGQVGGLVVGGLQDRVAERPPARSWLGGWLSSGDVVRLVEAALTADVRYGVYHAHAVHDDLSQAPDGARLAHLT
jgi:hypothetical protein